MTGKATAVVQDAEAYHPVLDIAARAEVREGIRHGLEDARKGRFGQRPSFSRNSKLSMV
jgi:hypothetical protein